MCLPLLPKTYYNYASHSVDWLGVDCSPMKGMGKVMGKTQNWMGRNQWMLMLSKRVLPWMRGLFDLEKNQSLIRSDAYLGFLFSEVEQHQWIISGRAVTNWQGQKWPTQIGQLEYSFKGKKRRRRLKHFLSNGASPALRIPLVCCFLLHTMWWFISRRVLKQERSFAMY